MYHHTAINVISLLQNMSNNNMNDMQLEAEFKKIEKQFQVKYEELVDLYNRMVLFQIDIEKHGGMRVYEKSAITWLKSELELLYEVYQFSQRHGLNIINISKYVSKKELNLFPKTESQLQNTYYKLKKCEIPFENIEKQETAKQVKSESKERIVATTVAVTEIMDALEVDLVGVPTSSKTLPKRYKGLPEVGNPMSPDMEKVKSLKPSEVLSVTTLEYELKPVFDGVGMKANFLDLTSLKNMQNSISNLGKKYGREKQAEEVVTKLDKKVTSIQKEVKGKKEPTV
ncbi:DNA-binding domain-containing protein, partial [Bacillus sp. D-CC]